jgi:hypothetical protein
VKHFPRQVFLRNGEAATLTGMVPVEGALMVQGIRHRTAAPDLWLASGKWTYREEDHPFDVVTIVTPQGEAVALNAIP